eukprot:CAMPEP_0117540090 /NCGR_PEP_ID=MMETSP0784-20121206/43320_1 /TAXON_ID=39447 /ORGANISM="" /LENGTH=274 /DNA_ID=CAMNT_0005336735 /DNA_START=248 /DNA_END=1070 /DNA_ORIENTATION=-
MGRIATCATLMMVVRVAVRNFSTATTLLQPEAGGGAPVVVGDVADAAAYRMEAGAKIRACRAARADLRRRFSEVWHHVFAACARVCGLRRSALLRAEALGPSGGYRFVGHLMVEASAMGLAPLALLPGWVNAVTQMDCWWIEEVSEGPQLARSHFPQVTLLERLAESYPTAKFILNFRDTDSWLRSVATYGPMRQILREAEVPGLPSGEGGEDRELALWFEQHVERVRAYFAQRDPDALMEMRLEEGDEVLKARLEGFLGVEVTWGCHNTTTWA